MTPYFEENKYQPFSRVSVAALTDLGYTVNMNAADPLIPHNHISSSDHNNNNNRMLDIDDKPKPSKTFQLDSSNMIRPDIHIIE